MPAFDTSESHCQIIDAADVAAKFVKRIQSEVLRRGADNNPVLRGILANDDFAAKKYADWTAKTCEKTGIKFELVEVDSMSAEEAVDAANNDPSVDGIMVYYPVFGDAQDEYLRNAVSIRKDVEALCHTYRYNMYHNIRSIQLPGGGASKSLLPCTPGAIVKILEYVGVYNHNLAEGNRMYGKTIAVVNRSEVVGRPLAALCANDGAKVYSIDVDDILVFSRGNGIKLHKHEIATTDISKSAALGNADVVISGVPVKGFKALVYNRHRGS
ncbi:methylenetetrahydrofolate dehydrogenase [NAD+], variant 1 [Sphaeroforma arctica JP610]|uniref:Methylenetetrahydrofolate dehydrogenase [NAD+], variant 1 n=1 Tax=Sphaeroforma arctica JP610 TaxID=667725 RepID=A0A0L0FYV5_9EUKA|nr:methylenetetrahydrofolate dehydrogenase [NAD+], variant 1 [Sphaeroforma arctica JP610]KNC81741.1 methylenetetrahydrofolate dehydrogenase [NAD+], variant 1 [Sphaeroforma arctica JP610]|eukprot:XP_014155643.1 methylenetetrahydrofolate dehydrogenase [NAD+], variant 1 [Sphaeroforma arctica JP610]